MPTFSELLRSDPGAYATAGRTLREQAQRLTEAAESFSRATGNLAGSWSGPAHEAQRTRATALADDVRQLAQRVETAAQVAAEGGRLLSAAVDQLRSMVNSARGGGFQVLETGLALPGPRHYAQAAEAGPAAPAVLAAYQAVAQTYTVMFQTVVAWATAVDAQVAAALRAGQLLPAGVGGRPGAPGSTGPGTSAAVREPTGSAPGDELTPERIEREFGIIARNQRAFQSFADRRDLVIDVRPTNPSSVPWLHEGALPKPQAIKAKTINDHDVLLGADPDSRGLVGYFRPGELPPRGEMSEADHAALARRREERLAEFDTYADTMAELGRRDVGDGRFEVDNGVVYGYDRDGVRRPVAGDHDIFDIRRTDGSRLSPAEYDRLIESMVARNMGVQHGAMTYWQPTKESDIRIAEKIMSAHGPGGEPLVRFAPRTPPRLVDSETPV